MVFHFSHEQERFVTKALDIKDLSRINLDDPPSFQYAEWFGTDLEALTYSGNFGYLALFAPLPSLRFLKAHLALLVAGGADEMRKDMENILATLPPSLEVLQLKLRPLSMSESLDHPWLAAPPDDIEISGLEFGPVEADEMLASIPESLCPKLRMLGVDADELVHCLALDAVSSRTPLRNLVAACERQKLPLVLRGEVAVAFDDIEGDFFGRLQDTT